MLIERRALNAELPAINEMSNLELCELLASLGFPVDGVETKDDQTVLEVDVTANRGDTLSQRGMARDIGAKCNAMLSAIPHRTLREGAPLFPVRLEADACPVYSTAILELGMVASTPADVVCFLSSMGSTAKQMPAVDASNELLHRYGHPTHAFDADTLKGALVVRWGRAGETLRTLDGVERTLTAEDLVIADEAAAIALAGVMGGDSTKVTAGTKRVLLESAWFDPRVVRRMSHRHGLHSDASYRFGRGVDPVMAQVARDLLAARLEDWAGAKLLGAWTAGQVPAARPAITLRKQTLARIAGTVIELTEAAALLRQLGCAVVIHDQYLESVSPSWRQDLTIEEDLAEEVLRLRGFDRIDSVLPPLEGAPLPLASSYLQARNVARRLAHVGFCQTVTLGFISPDVDADFAGADNPPEGRTLGNPLGQEFSVMRPTLLASLKTTAELNLRQGAKEVKLFEVGPIYRSTAEGPSESLALAVVWAGSLGGEDYLTRLRPVQAADLLGIIRDLGVKGAIALQELGEGMLGVEISLSALPEHEDRIIPKFIPFSRFPTVERDLSLLVDLAQPYVDLEVAMAKALRRAAGGCFQSLGCVDVFRHKSLPTGRQAWLMRLRFQGDDRTLTSDEVDGWVNAALEAGQGLGAELRG